MTARIRIAVSGAIFLSVTLLVATPVTAQEVEAQTTASQVQPDTKPDQSSIRVALDANGQIKLNGETVERANLRMRLQDLLKTRTDKTAIVIAAPATPFSAVVNMINLVRAAGATRVGLLPEEPAR